MRTVNKKPVWY